MTNAGVKELAPLKNLTALFLIRTKVTNAGLKELAPLKNLFILELTGTKVTEAGGKAFQKGLPECKVLRWSFAATGALVGLASFLASRPARHNKLSR